MFWVVAKYRKAVHFLLHVNVSVALMCACASPGLSPVLNNTHTCKLASRHLGTFILTQRNRVLFETLVTAQLFKKSPVFYQTRMLSPLANIFRQINLQALRSISILGLFYHLRQGFLTGLFLSRLSDQILYAFSISLAPSATCPAYF